jgi:hypothetical protein
VACGWNIVLSWVWLATSQLYWIRTTLPGYKKRVFNSWPDSHFREIMKVKWNDAQSVAKIYTRFLAKEYAKIGSLRETALTKLSGGFFL